MAKKSKKSFWRKCGNCGVDTSTQIKLWVLNYIAKAMRIELHHKGVIPLGYFAPREKGIRIGACVKD